tara:strand:- start:597 stop:1289 length:693 start_codon:yes stop_codon:yes gene_type:complete
MTSGVLVFSRLNSTRLPGKALKKIAGITLVDRVLDKLEGVKGISRTIVATTESYLDDPLVAHLKTRGTDVFRGSIDDVALRAVCCARDYKLDYFVRVSGDSPFIDSNLINKALLEYQNGCFDLVTNIFPRSFPNGASVEVIGTSSMQKLLSLTQDPYDREHVTPYFYKNAGNFRIKNLSSGNKKYQGVNLAIDTPEDLRRVTWMLETYGERLNLNLAVEKYLIWERNYAI